MKKDFLNCSVIELQETEAASIYGGGSGFEWLGRVVGTIQNAWEAIQAGTAEGGFTKCKVG